MFFSDKCVNCVKAHQARETSALLVGVTGHHAVKRGLQAGLLAVDAAHHAVHRCKLFLVAGQQGVHSRLQLGQTLTVLGVLGVGVVALG